MIIFELFIKNAYSVSPGKADYWLSSNIRFVLLAIGFYSCLIHCPKENKMPAHKDHLINEYIGFFDHCSLK